MDSKVLRLKSSEGSDNYLDTVVNLIRFSVFIVDTNMTIIWANHAAQSLLKVGDILCKSGGQLRSANQMESARLKKFLHNAMNCNQSNVRETVISLRSLQSGRFCELVACRVQTNDFTPQIQQLPAAVLIVSDPSQRTSVPSSILKSLFGLTCSERRLAKALLNGCTLDQYAVEMRISVNTARTHLKSIFRKTDSTSQAGLVSLLSRLVPPVEVESEDS